MTDYDMISFHFVSRIKSREFSRYNKRENRRFYEGSNELIHILRKKYREKKHSYHNPDLSKTKYRHYIDY